MEIAEATYHMATIFEEPGSKKLHRKSDAWQAKPLFQHMRYRIQFDESDKTGLWVLSSVHSVWHKIAMPNLLLRSITSVNNIRCSLWQISGTFCKPCTWFSALYDSLCTNVQDWLRQMKDDLGMQKHSSKFSWNLTLRVPLLGQILAMCTSH